MLPPVPDVTDPPAPLTVPRRFNGPPSSGNGGWVAGALAQHVAPGPVRVVLRQPPPLDTPLDVELAGDDGIDGAARLLHRGAVVAEAAPAEQDLEPVPPVDAGTAEAAGERYAGLRFHPFPGCFVCGTDRGPDDGLRIFPGRVEDHDGRARVAALWTPGPSLGSPEVSPAVAWAALDCAGGWAGDLEQRLMVLGTMTALVRDLPRTDETYVVVGADRGTEGRRTRTATTLYDAAGRVAATAEHVWIAVDPKDFA